MKLVSFIGADGAPGCGTVKDGGVVDLGRRLGGKGATSLRTLLGHGLLGAAQDAVAAAAPDMDLEGLTFAPTIPDPDKIICVGLNYRDHVAETGRTETAKPALFARFAGSQVGHLQPLVKPAVSGEFDYEGELVVVIGTAGRHIPAGRALAHVGSRRTPPLWMRPGDVAEVEISGVGVLRNPVVAE